MFAFTPQAYTCSATGSSDALQRLPLSPEMRSRKGLPITCYVRPECEHADQCRDPMGTHAENMHISMWAHAAAHRVFRPLFDLSDAHLAHILDICYTSDVLKLIFSQADTSSEKQTQLAKATTNFENTKTSHDTRHCKQISTRNAHVTTHRVLPSTTNTCSYS